MGSSSRDADIDGQVEAPGELTGVIEVDGSTAGEIGGDDGLGAEDVDEIALTQLGFLDEAAQSFDRRKLLEFSSGRAAFVFKHQEVKKSHD
jgi:hypothetical protein